MYRLTAKGDENYIYLGKRLIAKDGIIDDNNAKQHFKPYGSSVEGAPNDVNYTGHKFDKITGLLYAQARYYDPAIGRFMSNDPVGFRGVGSFNRYAYGNNNPYKYTDPSGQTAMIIGEIAIESGVAASVVCTPICGVIVGGVVFFGGIYAVDKITGHFNESADTPPIPEGLVGSQEDDRAGPARGKRWNSGPLLPELGGTGNAEDDFDGPISEGQGGESRPDRAPGSRTAPNGATIRPGKAGEGPRIDLPEKENAPPETLHYPPPETEKNKQ